MPEILEPTQTRAITLERELAVWLVQNHPEIAERHKLVLKHLPLTIERYLENADDIWSYSRLAQEYLPEEFKRSPRVAIASVGFALEFMLSRTERVRLEKIYTQVGGYKSISSRRKH